MKKFEIKENMLDKVISYFNPVEGARRYQARAVTALTGGYVGASKSRRSMIEWGTSKGDADADMLLDLPTLRSRSRDLARNECIGTGIINTKVTNVVGSGLRLQSMVDWKYLGMTEEQASAWQSNTEREFRLWSESKLCDLEKKNNFYELQGLAFRSVLENGDVFALLPVAENTGMPYGTRVQLIEADRISNPDFKDDTDTLAGGVERDEFGAPVAYHISKQHPGARNRTVTQWHKFDAFGEITGRRNVLHLYKTLRIGQTRGVPDLSPVIEKIRQLGDYTESEATAAVVSSLFTAFIKTEGGESLAPMDPVAETGGKTSDKDYKMGSGAILDLMPGEDITFANPNRPNSAFESFVESVMRQIGMAVELPFEIMIKHFTSSYSASRAAMMEAWKFFRTCREWLADNYCQPIYEEWLTEAVALGRISAPGFLNGDPAVRKAYLGSQWIGPARGFIDELKEIKAAELRVGMGVSTLAEETSQLTGGDWEQKHAQRAKEVKARRESGLEEPIVAEEPDEEVDGEGQKNDRRKED